MASKQLGKLRQWAGEVISSKDKSTVSEEFRDLEQDLELRKQGANRVKLASQAYHSAISKVSEPIDDGRSSHKLLPIDALGVVMIAHGEEFGEDSAYGISLARLGRAHCKIATLQEAYALTLQDTFLSSLEKFSASFKDYEALKKKLESRRLSFDTAITRLQKAKKEKERKEAEEEHEKAKIRYEDVFDELQSCMHAIQDNEINQQRDMTAFLDLEMRFVEQYLEVLRDVKSDWPDAQLVIRGPQSIIRRPSRGIIRDTAPLDEDTRSQKSTDTRRRKNSDAGTIPSRSSSRASRKRAESAIEKEREKDRPARRLSVAGWASAVTGRGKQKFTALMDDDAGGLTGENGEEPMVELKRPSSRSSKSSISSLSKSRQTSNSNTFTVSSARILRPLALQNKKVVRALYDFKGSEDELDFKAGDEIIVVNEVVDDWWMGELHGKQGLFPSSFVEVINGRERRVYGASFSEDEPFPLDGNSGNSSDSSDLDDHLARPLDIQSESRPFYVPAENASIISTDEEDPAWAHEQSAAQVQRMLNAPPSIIRTRSNPESVQTSGKRAPPPPPPRRLSNNMLSLPSTPLSALHSSNKKGPSPFDDTADFSGDRRRNF